MKYLFEKAGLILLSSALCIMLGIVAEAPHIPPEIYGIGLP